MISIQLILPFLFWTIRAQVWNYTKAGADWNGNCSEGAHETQSPINIQLSHCQCNDQMSIQVDFAEDLASAKGVLKLSGNPGSFYIDVTQSFAHLYFKAQKGRSRLYKSKKLIFRTPSEHKVDDKSYPMEMQLQFTSIFDEPLTLSIFYDYSDKNLTNAIFADTLRTVTNLTASPVKGVNVTFQNYINYNKLLPEEPRFFHYNGSRTDTDCREEWRWIVVTDPFYLKYDDLMAYKTALANFTAVNTNARTEQDLNDRVVYVSSSMCTDFFSNVIWFSFLYCTVAYFVFKML